MPARIGYVSLLLILASSLIPMNNYSSSSTSLTIIVTFPNLADDVNLIKCDSDKVYSLLPPSVDPHDYSLTPADVELLKHADLIISTAHTHFELRISELRNQSTIKAVVLEIPKVSGIKLLRNPSTGLPNLHMPIYDPNNYLEFLRNLTNTLKLLNPACAGVYEARYESVMDQVSKLLGSIKRLNLKGVGVKPVVQYAVSWLGINLTGFLIPEEGVSPTPNTIRWVEEQVKNGYLDVIVVTVEEDAYVNYLKDLGARYGVPVLEVPLPFTEGSVISKLEIIADQITKIKTSTTVDKTDGREYLNNTFLLIVLGATASLLLTWLVSHTIRGKKINAYLGGR